MNITTTLFGLTVLLVLIAAARFRKTKLPVFWGMVALAAIVQLIGLFYQSYTAVGIAAYVLVFVFEVFIVCFAVDEIKERRTRK